ncbi:MAG: transporter substrate-binding domain-containing protein [Pseudomonadota bacterium]
MRRPAVGALLAAWLLLLCITAPQAAGGPYRFRQAAQPGMVTPATDLLDAQERAFIAGLPVLRVGLNLPDNRPYEVIAENGEISGIQVEILTRLAQSMGLRLEPVVLPSFSAALDALRERRIDVMATVGYEPSREAYMAYTLGTAPNPGAVLGRQADNRLAAEPSLNGRRVAIERGYVTRYYVQRLYPDALISERDDTADALRAVALGEDDYYFGSLMMALDRLQRDGIGGLAVKRSMTYATGQMHFGVRSDWPLLASALSKGVATVRPSPMPALQAALDSLGSQAAQLPKALVLRPEEQRQLAGRSVLRVGAVRGLTLLNEATASGGHAGIAADYTGEVAARLGTAVDVVPFDSVADMLDALRAGRIHLVPFLTRTPARAREFSFSDPYLEMPYQIVARSDAPLYWDLNSLRGKRLALAAQHPLRELLAERYPDIRVVDAPSGQAAMDLVAAGDADAAVEAKLYANLRINSDNNGVLRQVARVDELPAQFHFATAKASAALVPLVNRALADIPPPERERLMRRWVAVDVAPGFPWRRWLPLLVTAGLALLLLAAATAWWMRRLSKEVAQRTQAEQRLLAVANSLPGVVFQYIASADGKLLQRYVSDAVDNFLGPGLHNVPSLFEAVALRAPAPQAALLRAARADCLATRQPFKQTALYNHPLRGPRWLHCEAVVRTLDGGRIAWTGYVVDVSSERALQAELLDAVQAKNLFVASASHELRAPLQAITLALARMGSGALDEAQRALWQMAQQASTTLVQLIDDVLDLAHYESGRLRLQPAPVALAALLQQIVEPHRLAAQTRGLALQLQLSPGQASLDALRLRQLLANLIGNAVKYTPTGRVLVCAAPDGDGGAPAGPGNGWLRLTVRDTGVGIPPERQAQLFTPFGMPQSGGLAAGERSHGLGLAICKRLVQAMQGETSLASQPGQGTEVVLRLPLLAAPAPPDDALIAAAGLLLPGRDGSVLLVDDDALSRLPLAELLRAAGYAVIEAADAEQGLALWRTQPVAAVISDRHMPGTDGPALLQRIADEALASGRRPPCRILCTGDAGDPAALLVDAVLDKPVTLAALHRALQAGGVHPGAAVAN